MRNQRYIDTDNLNNYLWVGDLENAEEVEKILKDAGIEHEKEIIKNSGVFRLNKSTFMNVWFGEEGNANELSITQYHNTKEKPRSVKLVFEAKSRK